MKCAVKGRGVYFPIHRSHNACLIRWGETLSQDQKFSTVINFISTFLLFISPTVLKLYSFQSLSASLHTPHEDYWQYSPPSCQSLLHPEQYISIGVQQRLAWDVIQSHDKYIAGRDSLSPSRLHVYSGIKIDIGWMAL